MSSLSRQEAQGWTHSVAGGVAGSAAVLFLHPFDVVKTRLQVQDGHQAQTSTYQGTVHAVRTMYKQEGWRAFYKGLVPAWIGSGVAWSAYFTLYEAVKRFHLRWQKVDRLSPQWHTASAAQAGAMVCLMTNPIWLIKTRLQLQTGKATAAVGDAAAAAASAPPSTSATLKSAPSSRQASTPSPPHTHSQSAPAPRPGHPGHAAGTFPATHTTHVSHAPSTAAATGAQSSPSPSATAAARQGVPAGAGPGSCVSGSRQYKGLVDAIVRIGREEGLRGYYKGLGPSLVLQTAHGAVQFTVYEEFKHMAARWGATSPSQPDRPITSLETSAIAAVSKLSASIITYPSQVVRSRIQQRFEAGSTRVYHNAREVVKLTWRGEGVRGFYKGLGPALIRVMPQSAVTLVVYEKSVQFLQADSP